MATTRRKIEDFAEELGTLLGTAEAKARGWLSERRQIAKTLEGIRDTATKLLSDLGHDVRAVIRPGRPAGTAKRRSGRPRKAGPPGRPKGRTKPAEARKKKE